MNTVWDTKVGTCIYLGEVDGVTVFDAFTGAVLIEQETVWFD